MPNLADNKKIFLNFEILESFDAGLALTGAEVKAVKNKNISLRGAYITYEKGELFLKNCHIGFYQRNNQPTHDPLRLKKILMRRREIDSIMGKMKQNGLTMVPVNVYTKKALIKIKIGLVRGRKQYDKRQVIKKREVARKISRALRQRL